MSNLGVLFYPVVEPSAPLDATFFWTKSGLVFVGDLGLEVGGGLVVQRGVKAQGVVVTVNEGCKIGLSDRISSVLKSNGERDELCKLLKAAKSDLLNANTPNGTVRNYSFKTTLGINDGINGGTYINGPFEKCLGGVNYKEYDLGITASISNGVITVTQVKLFCVITDLYDFDYTRVDSRNLSNAGANIEIAWRMTRSPSNNVGKIFATHITIDSVLPNSINSLFNDLIRSLP